MSGKTALIGICLLLLGAGGFGGYVLLERHLTPRRAAVARTLPPLEFGRGRGLRYTFVDTGGALQEAATPDDVPEDARELVRVTHPNVRRTDRTASLVYVADLRVRSPDGGYPYRVMTEAQFRALALPQMSDTGMHVKYEPEPTPPPLPPAAAARGQGKPKPAGRPPRAGGSPLPRSPATDRPAPLPARAAQKSVTLYTTAWCPACTQARTYLRRRGIQFADHDIEKDPQANRAYARKCARLGQPPGRVPGVEIDGHLMIGFAPGRVESLLRR